ncbi:E3 ubiquitin-protein ligase listerin [Armadillidium vulgare]|nr:E3 ubiquitin-protein ligase listerin [Armadillidium vulgare]
MNKHGRDLLHQNHVRVEPFKLHGKSKLNALQEFENLCTTEDVESIKTALPYWPRLYSKLSIDCDRRVSRESTQSAHTALVSQIGKELAPCLRSVMPSWLLAMTDPHAPAAIAATKSFQSAFSEEKRPGVMIFCSKEIIETIFDNLFIQSSQTMSDPKTTEKEDQDSKYVRVLYCSLKGLCLLLEMTSKLSDKKTEVGNKIMPFFREKKFWKLAKHESNMIVYKMIIMENFMIEIQGIPGDGDETNVRCAWFDTIKSLFEYNVGILSPWLSQLSNLIFSSLDCQESVVLPHIWIAFLHLCVGLPV